MLTASERAGLVADLLRSSSAARGAQLQVDRDVAECRQRGLSWQEIAGALGVSKQAAHRRYRSTRVELDDRPLPW